MSNSSKLYITITTCFAIAFLGFLLVRSALTDALFYVLLALGTLLFFFRISRGDD